MIRESAKTALEELRGVIGVLREDGDESLTQPPQPTLADLAALVEESRAAGMRVTARIELGDAAPPAAVGRTAYRIAQEGLTNARKHAPGAAVTLTVRAPDGDLQVEVRSLAPVAVAAAAALPGAGTGLIGLAERVSLPAARSSTASTPTATVRPACEPATMIRVLLVDDDALVHPGIDHAGRSREPRRGRRGRGRPRGARGCSTCTGPT